MAKFYDTLLWEYIKNPWVKGLSLDDIASKEFDYKMISYDEVSEKQTKNFTEVDLVTASKYSAEDVYITNLIYQKQLKEWVVDNKVLKNIENPLIEVLRDIEINWVKIDQNKLKQIWVFLEKEIINQEKIIFEIAWEEFNLKSPKQVWEILFDKLQLPQGKKTKTWYSVDNEVLEYLALEHPIAKHIVLYRWYFKILSTYVEWLLKLVDKDTKKIHTSYNQAVTTTWRLSSTSPNLQNIPTWKDVYWSIREAFIPYKENDLIVSFDYSQIEVRLLAIMSWDENLTWSFLQNLDIHKMTWYFLFWKDDITSEERKIAKAVNFWVIYWISPFWLSKMIWISQKQAKEYIDKFYEKYPKVKDFFSKTIEFCEKNLYVETLFWRKRFIDWINDRNAIIKKAKEREAINMPIQWTSADIIKIAMIKINDFLIKNDLKSCMIMQVHDELVFNVVENEFEIIKKEIPLIMENIIDDKIKLKVDMWFWKNWGECK